MYPSTDRAIVYITKVALTIYFNSVRFVITLFN